MPWKINKSQNEVEIVQSHDRKHPEETRLTEVEVDVGTFPM